MQIVTVATPLLLVVLTLAVGYVFKERADHREAKLDIILDQIEELAVQIAAKPDRNELIGQVGRVESRFDQVESRFERIELQLASLRADLTQIALAVGARLRPQTG